MTGRKRSVEMRRNWDLYLLCIPVVVFYGLFFYWPMYGAQIAFRDFSAYKGIWGSNWVGLKHFQTFVNSHYFRTLLSNTFLISIYQLLVNFPLPIILALSLNELSNRHYKKLVQTVTYAPHFISQVVLISLLQAMLSSRYGIINEVLKSSGLSPVNFLQSSHWFRTVYVVSGAWQSTGWGSVIYIAALSAVSEDLHEAAKIDGANRMQRILHINLPALVPTAVTLLILNVGRTMDIGFEKVFLLQNDLNISVSNVISTYVYNVGLLKGQFSYGSAIGLFNSVINLALLLGVNLVAKRASGNSLM